MSNNYLGNEEIPFIPSCSLVCQIRKKNSISSNSDAISGIKKCLRYIRYFHKGQSCSVLFIILILHGRIASVDLGFSISLMCLIRSHTTVEGDCKREAQVETRTWQLSCPAPVKVWYPWVTIWRCKWGPFWSSCERRKHVNVGWEMLVNAMCSELRFLWAEILFCYLVCEKNDTYTGVGGKAEPLSAISRFPLLVTYSHVLFGKPQLRRFKKKPLNLEALK